MSNLNVPSAPASASSWTALATINFAAFLALRNDGNGSTLGLPGHTMLLPNTVTSNVKLPVGKQENYQASVKLSRVVTTPASLLVNPAARITIEVIVKAPKSCEQQEILDAVYDATSLLANEKVHRDLFLRGVALHNVA